MSNHFDFEAFKAQAIEQRPRERWIVILRMASLN